MLVALNSWDSRCRSSSPYYVLKQAGVVGQGRQMTAQLPHCLHPLLPHKPAITPPNRYLNRDLGTRARTYHILIIYRSIIGSGAPAILVEA